QIAELGVPPGAGVEVGSLVADLRPDATQMRPTVLVGRSFDALAQEFDQLDVALELVRGRALARLRSRARQHLEVGELVTRVHERAGRLAGTEPVDQS